MGKAFVTILVLAVATSSWLAYARTREPVNSSSPPHNMDPTDRVGIARREREKLIAEKYRAMAVIYPGEIFIRWFKHEAVVELWARNGNRRFRLVASYPILASSGGPGPKRRQGDRQVPEGFYEVDRFNPKSLFHLSLGLNYPNAADRVHADPQKPGGDIFIHGRDVSIGCAPIGDEAIEELYLAASDARDAGQKKIAAHIFPARMRGPEWDKFAAEQTAQRPELKAFWEQLLPAYDAFENRRLVPKVKITKEGRYALSAR
jgi:murein L,D-transpeptidase YafK